MLQRAFLMAASLLGLAAAGCNTTSTKGTGSDVAGLAKSKGAKNIALLMSGLNKDEFDLEASMEATAYLKEALQTLQPTSPFEIREYHDLTKDELLAHTKQAAQDVGNDGTLFWYIGTHGWTDGFSMKEGRVNARDLGEALNAARGAAPMARLLMLFDYCGSGGLASEMQLTSDAKVAQGIDDGRDDGLLDLSRWTPAAGGGTTGLAFNAFFVDLAASIDGGLGLKDETQKPYRQALFFAATRPNQTTEGSTFTGWIAETIKVNAAKSTMTIGQFLDETVVKIGTVTTEEYPTDDAEPVKKKQIAVFRALPDNEILEDALFAAGSDATP